MADVYSASNVNLDNYEHLIYEAGILEAVRRYVKVTDNYAIKKDVLLAIMGVDVDE